jgi:L-threonylcarbamoyladenylate synthase
MLQETRILPYGQAAIAEAAALVARGQPIAIPTETVYSLIADATSGEAVERVYEAKGRSSFNPLIAHVPDLPMAQTIGQFDAQALALAKAHLARSAYVGRAAGTRASA